MSLPAVLDMATACALLECEQETLAERASRGEVPAVKFGRGWVFPAESFVARLNELAVEEAERRRRRPAVRAVIAGNAPAGAPPTLPEPAPVAQPSPRRGARRSEPPSLCLPTP